MDVKLTLKLDRDAIERAKHYASRRQTSLSRMVQVFFEQLDDNESPPAGTLVRSLAGSVPVPESFDDDYAEYLWKKYSP
jgi:hypothetical protein